MKLYIYIYIYPQIFFIVCYITNCFLTVLEKKPKKLQNEVRFISPILECPFLLAERKGLLTKHVHALNWCLKSKLIGTDSVPNYCNGWDA
jgi:hypothetical protein